MTQTKDVVTIIHRIAGRDPELREMIVEETSKAQVENIIPFPLPHRGDPDSRRMALASIGFRWQAQMWRRSRVVLSDADIDTMDTHTWEQSLRRWTKRRPQRRP